MKSFVIVSAIAVLLCFSPRHGFTNSHVTTSAQLQLQNQEPIYGSHLMTPQERTKYRAKMSAAKTDAEREQIRKKHEALMLIRARARGIQLPPQGKTGTAPHNERRPGGYAI